MKVLKLEVAAPKGEDSYQWFCYTGKPLPMQSRAGTKLTLHKGDCFGVRPSGDKKKIRFVSESLGVNKVFTLTSEQAAFLAKRCKVR